MSISEEIRAMWEDGVILENETVLTTSIAKEVDGRVSRRTIAILRDTSGNKVYVSGLVVKNELIRETWLSLGSEGQKFFKKCWEWFGTVAPVIHPEVVSRFFGYREKKHDIRIPHPVHFREGTEVRNFLRGRAECIGWSDHELDEAWSLVVMRGVQRFGYPVKSPVDRLGQR